MSKTPPYYFWTSDAELGKVGAMVGGCRVRVLGVGEYSRFLYGCIEGVFGRLVRGELGRGSGELGAGSEEVGAGDWVHNFCVDFAEFGGWEPAMRGRKKMIDFGPRIMIYRLAVRRSAKEELKSKCDC
jgi:hypothetical protein